MKKDFFKFPILLYVFILASCASPQTEKLRKSLPSHSNLMVVKAGELYCMGQTKIAEKNLKTALALFQIEDDQQNIIKVYNQLSMIALIRNDLKNTRHYINSAKNIANKEGYRFLYVDIALNEASLFIAEGNPEKAKDILNSFNNQPTEESKAKIANSLGRVAMAQADFKKAQTFFEEALKLTGEDKNRLFESAVKKNLGALFFKMQDMDKALHQFKEVLKVYKKNKIPLSIGETLHFIGKAYEGKNDFENALYYYNRALKINIHIDIPGRADMDKNAINLIKKLH